MIADLVKGGPRANQVAAASGIGFVALALSLFIVQEWYNFANVGQFALLASNEVWGSFVLLMGVAGALLFWFVSTAAERLRQIEQTAGGSGRLARAFFASGSAIAIIFVLQVGVQFAARQVSDVEIAALAASFIEGPTFLFPLIVLLYSAGLIAVRAGDMLPAISQQVGRLALAASAVSLLLAGLQIFYNYAWIDETAYLMLLGFVLALSVIGVQRWGELDTGFTPESAAAAPAPAREPEAVELPPAKAPARKKPASRKTTARKPASRKTSARKKPSPRKR